MATRNVCLPVLFLCPIFRFFFDDRHKSTSSSDVLDWVCLSGPGLGDSPRRRALSSIHVAQGRWHSQLYSQSILPMSICRDRRNPDLFLPLRPHIEKREEWGKVISAPRRLAVRPIIPKENRSFEWREALSLLPLPLLYGQPFLRLLCSLGFHFPFGRRGISDSLEKRKNKKACLEPF